jgi:AcrR family transcriptional regulator
MARRSGQGRTPGGRLPAAEAAQIPDRLLDAAGGLFAEIGFARTTMDAIARRAGASSKTVYSRYPNKEAVLAAVVRRLLDRAVAASGVAARPDLKADDPRQFLTRVGREMASLSAGGETIGFRRLVMAEAYQFPELAQVFIDMHERAIGVVRGPLEAWRAEGVLPLVPDPRLAALIFVEMAASIPRIRALLGQPLDERETMRIVRTAVDLFLRGCGYTPDMPRRKPAKPAR